MMVVGHDFCGNSAGVGEGSCQTLLTVGRFSPEDENRLYNNH